MLAKIAAIRVLPLSVLIAPSLGCSATPPPESATKAPPWPTALPPKEMPRAAPSQPARPSSEAPCSRRFEPTYDLSTDLSNLSAACAKLDGFSPVTEVRTTTQTEAAPSDRFSFPADKGRCYRVFATSSKGILNLDLALLSEGGALEAIERNVHPWSVVPEADAYCAKRDQILTVSLAVREGEGEYALQVWAK